LYNLADWLSSHAADSVGQEALLAGGTGLTLTDARVAGVVSAELAAYPFPEELPEGLRVVEARTSDGRTVVVRLTATSHPPLLSWFTRAFDAGFGLDATSSARVFLGTGG
jgi:hypothetical protein